MKKIFASLLLVLLSAVAYSQSTVLLRGDTIKVYKNGGYAEFVLKNKTLAKTGAFLKNSGAGVTSFSYAVDTVYKYGDNLVVCRGDGCDTIAVSASLSYSLNPSTWLVSPSASAQHNLPEFHTSIGGGEPTGGYYESSMYTPSPVKMNDGRLYVWTKGDLNKVIYGWRSLDKGITWDTVGQTLSKGGAGTFDEFSVAMPAAYHIAATDSVYLYYHGIPVYPYNGGGVGLAVAAGSNPNVMTKKKQVLSIPDFRTQMGISHDLIYVAVGSVVKSGTEYYYYGAYWKAEFGMTDSTIRIWEGHSNSLDTIKNCREILAPSAPYTAYYQPTVFHGADSAWYMIFPKGYTDENGGIDSAMFLMSAKAASLGGAWSELPGRLYEHDVDSTWKGKRVYNAQLLKDEYGNPILMARDSVYGYPDNSTEPFYMLFYSGSYTNSYHDQSSYLKLMPQTDSLTFGIGVDGNRPNITRRGTSTIFNFPYADSSRDGLISRGDWTIFNNKAPASGSGNYVHQQILGNQGAGTGYWVDVGIVDTRLTFNYPYFGTGGHMFAIANGIQFQSGKVTHQANAGLFFDNIIFDSRSSATTTTPIIFSSPHITGFSTAITQNNFSLLNVGDIIYPTIPSPFNTTSSALTNYSARIINYGRRASGSNALTNVALYLEADSAQNNNALIVGNGNSGFKTATPNSIVQINGSLATALASKTANYTATANDYTIVFTSGTDTLTLPTAVGIAGRIYVYKNLTGNNGVIATTSSETIDGAAAPITAIADKKYYMLQSDGANWIIISNN